MIAEYLVVRPSGIPARLPEGPAVSGAVGQLPVPPLLTPATAAHQSRHGGPHSRSLVRVTIERGIFCLLRVWQSTKRY